MQHWFFLAGAIFLEVGGTIAMKVSDGFSKLTPSIIMTICYIASLALLTLALKKIELSIAYAIWAGVGTALIATVGILYFKEPATAIKILSLVLIITGVVGLNLSGAKG